MAKIFISLKNFIREDYSLRYYLFTTLFLILTISLNYQYEIEDRLISGQAKPSQFFFYFLLYGTAYYGTLLILLLTKGKNYFYNPEVLFKSFMAILILSIDGAFSFTSDFFQACFESSAAEGWFLKKIANQIFPSLLYFSFLWWVRKKYDPTTSALYGLTAKGFDFKPYLILLAGMLPLITWASFQQDFIQEYPVFKYWKQESVFGLSQFQMFGIYECFYLLDFINVELLFRGLLIIGLVKTMEKDVLLPMIVLYASLHFGKPAAETISSVLGGYMLGVLAYRTNTILGGFLIHMGIAFLMDFTAILQHLWER